MDEKEEQELIKKGLRYRPRITEARTYIIDPLTGEEIAGLKEVKKDVTDEIIRNPTIRKS
jgi:hypothetical protein